MRSTAWTAWCRPSRPSAVTADLAVLHPGEGVLDAGADPAMRGVVGLLQGQQRPFAAASVRHHQAGAPVGAVGEHGDSGTRLGQAGVSESMGIGCVAGHRSPGGNHQMN